MEVVDITNDGNWLFSVCYETQNSLLFQYQHNISSFVKEQEINNDLASKSWAGGITNDFQIVALGKSDGNVHIYKYDNNTNNFIYSQNLSNHDSYIKHIEFSENNIFMVVSTSYSVYVYKYDGSQYQHHNQTITFAKSYSRTASITRDNKYLVISDEVAIAPEFRIYIYKFNETTEIFDEPDNMDILKFDNDPWYSSLSRDKKYLAISSSPGFTYLYSSPLSEDILLEQSLDGSFYHKFSNDGKYLITSGDGIIQVYIDCNWNTSGGYFLNNDTSVC